MTVVTGVLLALLTCALGVAAVTLLGLPWAAALGRGAPRGTVARHALWWGLLAASALVLGVNQVSPLGSPSAITIALAIVAASGLLGAGILRRATPKPRSRMSRSGHVLVATVALFSVVLAIRILGPVTNYDSGLYHLGAIQYAEQYAAIPGLANLYFAYGYATTQFPLAALLTWSPLGQEGYRALNVIILLLAVIDLLIRVLRREKSAGTYVLAAGVSVIAFTMLPLADYWVISPTQDASVFTLTVVAGAYLSEALTRGRWVLPAATSVVVAVSAMLVRTTMVAFLLVLLLVLFVTAVRRRRTWSTQRIGMTTCLTIGISTVSLALSAARDYVLSGWWLYPLSVLPFDIPWRAPDPIEPRTATLGAARDPANLWDAAQSWSWIPSWWSRALSAWELYAALLLVVLAVVLAVMSRPPRLVLAALAPSLISTVFWFTLTPPSFRFAWGPLFSVATITIGWCMWTRSRTSARTLRNVTLLTSLALVAASVITLAFRIDYSSMSEVHIATGVPLEFSVAPVTIAQVRELTLPSGLRALTPVSGDQCWEAFPLCSPQVPAGLRLRGVDLQSGFLP